MRRAPRVGIVGARRSRQGLGPFVARELLRAGAEVPCLCTTRQETAAEARDRLRATSGVETRAYDRVDEMLAREDLDAVAILSPAESHEGHLERALAAKLHALCEKPLVWGTPEVGARGEALARRFDDAGLLLREVCQWPFTRDAFAALHPGVLEQPLASFAMRLAPRSTGRQSLGDALPHPLSLLQALAPGVDARVGGARFAARPHGLRVAFDYRAGDATVQSEVELEQTEAAVRPAAWAANGRWIHRRVRAEDYSFFFEADGREVASADPLACLVGTFVADLGRRLAGHETVAATREIAARARMLDTLVGALPEELAA